MKFNQKMELEDHVSCITMCYYHVPTYPTKHNLNLRKNLQAMSKRSNKQKA